MKVGPPSSISTSYTIIFTIPPWIFLFIINNTSVSNELSCDYVLDTVLSTLCLISIPQNKPKRSFDLFLSDEDLKFREKQPPGAI